MREKELRLALVLTGGVSLIVYMHGVSKEILKLTRASKIYHGAAHDIRAKTSYQSLNDDLTRESDTEEIYFELLQLLAPSVDVAVIVDVIAGASAGGVTGIMLGRALAHDLSLDDHRTMWLENADVLELMDKQTSARPWSKFYLDIIIRVFFSKRLREIAPEKETREKLRRFLRSRWFHPPFSGKRYSGWLLKAFRAMKTGGDEAASLMPDGHELDVLIAVTDFYGHARTISLHDPAVINEPEHRHVMRFSYLNRRDGERVSDFDNDCVPGLVFAARASSSFPGAFPPSDLAEIDEVLHKRGEIWHDREAFYQNKLAPVAASTENSAEALFIDGSIVLNKPFDAAIRAIANKAAHRDVIRRVVFIDPNPDSPSNKAGEQDKPGMFRTLLTAMVDIPSHDPIGDELERVNVLNRQIRSLRRVADLARPGIGDLVDKIIDPDDERAPSAGQIDIWRTEANNAAARGAGIAYDSYLRLKILNVLSRIAGLISDISHHAGVTISKERLNAALTLWIERQGSAFAADGMDGGGKSDRDGEIVMLRSFDVDFRVRRFRFVIRRLNELYRLETDGELPQTNRLDEVKTVLFSMLDETRTRWQHETYNSDLVSAVTRLGGLVEAGGDGEDDEDTARALDGVMALLGEAMALVETDERVDEVFAVMVLNYLPRAARHELTVSYIGFSFFDVLTYTMLPPDEYDDLEEVLIDRISPEDANAIRPGGAADKLKGTGLRHFGAFLNRAYRENDYLWGRLSAADRLIDIVAGALDDVAPIEQAKLDDLKHRLFEKILDAEQPFLKRCPDLISQIRKDMAARTQAHD